MHYAVVSFGGSWPGKSVYASVDEAVAELTQAERDTQQMDGDLVCDPQVLARARIQEYDTREAALAADISDTTDSNRRRPTPGFRRVVRIWQG